MSDQSFPTIKRALACSLLWCLVVVVQCKQLNLSQEDRVMARVGSEYLYSSDLPVLPRTLTSEQDSILWVRDYINRWGRQQLLYKQARINLSDAQQLELESSIQEYRLELFANTYKDQLLDQFRNDTLSENDLKYYYEKNIKNFRLQFPIVKYRSIRLMHTHPDFDQIKYHFLNYQSKDQKYLDSLHYQFEYSQLNDSIWMEFSIRSIPDSSVFAQLKQQMSKNSQFFELKDSLHVSLNWIVDHKAVGDYTPYNLIRPTLKNILNNQQRVQTQKNFELQLIQDALKNKTFEIYE